MFLRLVGNTAALNFNPVATESLKGYIHQKNPNNLDFFVSTMSENGSKNVRKLPCGEYIKMSEKNQNLKIPKAQRNQRFSSRKL